MKKSTAEQMQHPARNHPKHPKHPKPPAAPIIVDVSFDDSSFDSNEYSAGIGDTLRFTNKYTSTLTIYVLSDDGESLSMDLLGDVSSFNVGSGLSVSQLVVGSGTYLVSLDPPPGLIGANDSGGGKTSTVIINT